MGLRIDCENMFAISFNSVSKEFKHQKKGKAVKFNALNNVSFNVEKGDVFGIIGRNGSGKSTLLNIINRIMKPTSGDVKVDGTVASILELGMGFHYDLSGRENIYSKGELYGFSKNEIESKIQEIIDYAELGDFIDDPIRTYSSGMIARLAFAIMITVEADIMLVDEVLSVGDNAFASKAIAHFKKVTSSGKTVIIVSHSIELIKSLCNHALWLDHGCIREIGDSNIVCTHYLTEIDNDVDVLIERSSAGDTVAMNRLGLKYCFGIDVLQD